MEDTKQRRKLFSECSRRHQRRLIREKKIEILSNTNITTNVTDSLIFDAGEIASDESFVDMNNSGYNSENNVSEESVTTIENNVQPYEINDDELLERNARDVAAANNEHEDVFCFENDPNEIITSDEETADNDSLEDDLREWARRNKSVTHTAIGELLKILLSNFPDCGLPKTANILLGTTETTDIVPIQGGEYVHMGLEPALAAFMDEYNDANLPVTHLLSCH